MYLLFIFQHIEVGHDPSLLEKIEEMFFYTQIYTNLSENVFCFTWNKVPFESGFVKWQRQMEEESTGTGVPSEQKCIFSFHNLQDRGLN